MKPNVWIALPAALALAVAPPAASPAAADTPGSSGAFGNALQLDGLDDYAWRAPTLSESPAGTVEFWMSADAFTASESMWGGGTGHPGTNGDFVRIGRHVVSNGLAFGVYPANPWRWASNGTIPPTGTWVHVAATWSDAGMRCYLDGVLVGENAYASGLPPYATELVGTSSWGDFFFGRIDELRVWNVERTQSEIQAAMSAPLAPAVYENPSSGVVAYYAFDALEDLGAAGDGPDDLRDLSPNGNHLDTAGAPELADGAVPVERATWTSVKAAFSR